MLVPAQHHRRPTGQDHKAYDATGGIVRATSASTIPYLRRSDPRLTIEQGFGTDPIKTEGTCPCMMGAPRQLTSPPVLHILSTVKIADPGRDAATGQQSVNQQCGAKVASNAFCKCATPARQDATWTKKEASKR